MAWQNMIVHRRLALCLPAEVDVEWDYACTQIGVDLIAKRSQFTIMAAGSCSKFLVAVS